MTVEIIEETFIFNENIKTADDFKREFNENYKEPLIQSYIKVCLEEVFRVMVAGVSYTKVSVPPVIHNEIINHLKCSGFKITEQYEHNKSILFYIHWC